jgi:hypothetical protein
MGNRPWDKTPPRPSFLRYNHVATLFKGNVSGRRFAHSTLRHATPFPGRETTIAARFRARVQSAAVSNVSLLMIITSKVPQAWKWSRESGENSKTRALCLVPNQWSKFARKSELYTIIYKVYAHEIFRRSRKCGGSYNSWNVLPCRGTWSKPCVG